MRNQTLRVIAVISIVCVATLAGCAAPATSPATVTASGVGVVIGQPDLTIITFGMWNKDEDADKALTDSKKKLVEVIVGLGALGIAEVDIEPFSNTLNAEQIMDAAGFPTDRHLYGVNQMLNVTVRDPAILGRALNTIRTIVGAPYLFSFGVNYGFSPERQSYWVAEAHTRALADARANAKRLAQSLGATLDAPISVKVVNAPLGPLSTSSLIQVTLEVTYPLK
jgi:uncharacterized protein YggE